MTTANPISLLDLVEGPKGYRPISIEKLQQRNFFPADDDWHFSQYTLYNNFWGQTESFLHSGRRSLTVPGLDLMGDKLFIFESYIRVLALLKEKKRRFFRGPSEAETWKDPAVYGCLIYGTQGIGKRNLLQLYLIISLALEHPILFFRSGMLYFHTPHGLFVSTANLGLIVESPLFHGLTLLVDLDIGFDQGAMYARKVWCIGTASPHAKDQDSFIKRLCAHQIVLDNPKFTELCEFYDVNTQSKREQLSASLDIIGPDLPRLRGFEPVEREIFLTQATWYLHSLPLNDLAELFKVFQYKTPSIKSLFCGITFAIPHTIKREDPAFTMDYPLYRVRSLSVMRLITQVYQKHQHKPLHDLYTTLHANRELRTAKGWVFECLCHDVITNGTELKLLPMKVVQNQLHRTSESDAETTIETLSIQPRTMSIFLSRSSKHSTAKHMTRDTKNYYVPAESNNPTFDGFLHGCDSANTLHAFQTTLGSKHYMKTEGLRKLVKSGYPNAPIQLIFLVVPGSNFTVPRPPKEYESQFRFFTCEMEFRSSFEFPLQPVDKMEVELESVEFE